MTQLSWRVEVRARLDRQEIPGGGLMRRWVCEWPVLRLKTDHPKDGWICDGLAEPGPKDEYGRATEMLVMRIPLFIPPSDEDRNAYVQDGRAPSALVAEAGKRWSALVHAHEGFGIAVVAGTCVQPFTGPVPKAAQPTAEPARRGPGRPRKAAA